MFFILIDTPSEMLYNHCAPRETTRKYLFIFRLRIYFNSDLTLYYIPLSFLSRDVRLLYETMTWYYFIISHFISTVNVSALKFIDSILNHATTQEASQCHIAVPPHESPTFIIQKFISGCNQPDKKGEKIMRVFTNMSEEALAEAMV